LNRDNGKWGEATEEKEQVFALVRVGNKKKTFFHQQIDSRWFSFGVSSLCYPIGLIDPFLVASESIS